VVRLQPEFPMHFVPREEIFDVNSENFHHNNANERFMPLNRALSHCISLIWERCPEMGWYRQQQKPEMW